MAARVPAVGLLRAVPEGSATIDRLHAVMDGAQPTNGRLYR